MRVAPQKNVSPRSLAIITGASGSLGREFAYQWSSHPLNCDTVLVDHEPTATMQPSANIEVSDKQADTYQMDVTDASAWQLLVDQLRVHHLQLDLLINCAGIGAGGELDVFSAADFRRVMDVNYFGTLYGCQAVIPWMKEQGHGHIVNVASITGLLAPPAMAAYASSKAAVVSLTESLYAELKPHGIGVTLCAPGFFPSPLITNGIFSDESTRQRGLEYTERTTLTAEEVARYTLDRVRRGKLYAVTGRRARWYWRAKRLAPQWLANKLSERYHRGD